MQTTTLETDAIAEILDQYQTLLDLKLTPSQAKEALLEALAVPVGGYADAAVKLRELTGRTYSRQAAQGLYDRRVINGFPEKRDFRVLTGKIVRAFSLTEVEEWQRRRRDRSWR